jgi:hypothetical protein
MKRRPRRFKGLAPYEFWILKCLESGKDGSQKISTVYEFVRENMSAQFTSRENSATSDDKEPVWKNEIRYARLNLITDGRMKEPNARGVWEISEKGRRWLGGHPVPRRLDGSWVEEDLESWFEEDSLIKES